MNRHRPKLVFFVTVDWFFYSHFFGRAIAARDAGFEVVVITDAKNHGKFIESAGLRLVPLPISRKSINPFSAAIALVRLVRIYVNEQPDIIHHVALKPILLGSLAARIAGCKNIVNAVVGGGYAFSSQNWRAGVIRRLLTSALRFLLNPPGSRVVFENSEDLRSFVDAKLARPNDSVLIRGAGVDPTQFSQNIGPEKPPIVVVVARLLWDKGIGDFVEAARIALSNGVRARFVVVGELDCDNRSCIDSATLEGWRAERAVEFWGFRSDIPQILARSTIACLPSYREGLPKSLLEAMAAGLPCVTTDVPGCREAVVDGHNGILVPARHPALLADAIQRLIHRPDLASHLGMRGRERVELHFSAEIVNESTLALYRETLAQHRDES